MLELEDHGLMPTTSMRNGLGGLAAALQDMAEHRLSSHHHLFSLDPGVGKTTMVKHFLDQLIRSDHHEGVSAVVFLSRLDEVGKRIRDLQGLGLRDHVGVFVGKEAGEQRFTKLGCVEPHKARVLITTQQMLTQRCRGRRFAKTSAFHYQGAPRPVRIWDESFMPGEEFSMSSDDLASLLVPARDRSEALATAVDDLRDVLRDATVNKRLHVSAMSGLSAQEAQAALYGISVDTNQAENVQTAARNLRDIAEMSPLVHHDSRNDGVKIMLDYRDTIPSDLAPMVILDASGRCRHTYKLMEAKRGNLICHDAVTKDYSNLEIGVWAIGGGRSSFAQDSESERHRGIAQTISKRPDEEWLVIHHKDRERAQPFRDQLRDFLSDEVLSRVSFLHWGDHHGTNDYAHIENVVLAGTFFLPDKVYEGRARLAAGLCDEDKLHPNVKQVVKEGEHMHGILQALCRASVRGVDAEGRCRPCRAYVIASNQSGIAKLLPDLFPGCTVSAWEPFPQQMTSNVEKVIDLIDWLLKHEADLWDFIPFSWLRDELDFKDKANFRKTVLKRDCFSSAIAERGLEVAEAQVDGRIQKGLRFIFPDDDDCAT
ncbi:hypothetical protein [Rhodosalinus sediminis]|nr:hypothetical protein [Rhodosalinus sediminis]